MTKQGVGIKKNVREYSEILWVLIKYIFKNPKAPCHNCLTQVKFPKCICQKYSKFKSFHNDLLPPLPFYLRIPMGLFVGFSLHSFLVKEFFASLTERFTSP